MPMDFPDMRSLENAAKIHDFRQHFIDEKESDYREALADHVRGRDVIESGEIRFGVGWDQWTDEQKRSEMQRAGL